MSDACYKGLWKTGASSQLFLQNRRPQCGSILDGSKKVQEVQLVRHASGRWPSLPYTSLAAVTIHEPELLGLCCLFLNEYLWRSGNTNRIAIYQVLSTYARQWPEPLTSITSFNCQDNLVREVFTTLWETELETSDNFLKVIQLGSGRSELRTESKVQRRKVLKPVEGFFKVFTDFFCFFW